MALTVKKLLLSSYYSSLRFSALSFKRIYSTKDDFSSDGLPKPKFRIFKDEDSPIILDIAEQFAYPNERKTERIVNEKRSEDKIPKRGDTGVFEIEELVSYLQRDNAKDIFVVKVPEDLKYVDYLVIVTGKSCRHMIGLAEYIRSIFKMKKHSSDVVPIIEGKDSSDWIAMDLGNIALHLMSNAAREKYDLESLWALGPQYDLKINQEDDEVSKLIKKHSINLEDMRPLEAL